MPYMSQQSKLNVDVRLRKKFYVKKWHFLRTGICTYLYLFLLNFPVSPSAPLTAGFQPHLKSHLIEKPAELITCTSLYSNQTHGTERSSLRILWSKRTSASIEYIFLVHLKQRWKMRSRGSKKKKKKNSPSYVPQRIRVCQRCRSNR